MHGAEVARVRPRLSKELACVHPPHSNRRTQYCHGHADVQSNRLERLLINSNTYFGNEAREVHITERKETVRSPTALSFRCTRRLTDRVQNANLHTEPRKIKHAECKIPQQMTITDTSARSVKQYTQKRKYTKHI